MVGPDLRIDCELFRYARTHRSAAIPRHAGSRARTRGYTCASPFGTRIHVYALRGCARTSAGKVAASFCFHRARLADAPILGAPLSTNCIYWVYRIGKPACLLVGWNPRIMLPIRPTGFHYVNVCDCSFLSLSRREVFFFIISFSPLLQRRYRVPICALHPRLTTRRDSCVFIFEFRHECTRNAEFAEFFNCRAQL